MISTVVGDETTAGTMLKSAMAGLVKLGMIERRRHRRNIRATARQLDERVASRRAGQ